MPKKIIAHFTPQAWVGGYATEIDSEGEQEWDATEFFDITRDDYRDELMAAMCCEGDSVLDHEDWFRNDETAPEWVRLHRGPFDIHLRWEETK